MEQYRLNDMDNRRQEDDIMWQLARDQNQTGNIAVTPAYILIRVVSTIKGSERSQKSKITNKGPIRLRKRYMKKYGTFYVAVITKPILVTLPSWLCISYHYNLYHGTRPSSEANY